MTFFQSRTTKSNNSVSKRVRNIRTGNPDKKQICGQILSSYKSTFKTKSGRLKYYAVAFSVVHSKHAYIARANNAR